MSWNRIALNLLVTFSLSTGYVHAQKVFPLTEDELIMRGILYEEYKAYENSYQVYKKLFDETGAEVYLFKEVTSALLAQKHIVESIDRLKMWDKKNPDQVAVRRLLIPLYLTNRNIEEARTEAGFLLEQSTAPQDLELASSSYLYSGDFERALELLSKVYESKPKESVLIRMVEILDELAHDRKKAIQLLETHRRMNISSNDVLLKLLQLYQKEKDIPGILETYKAMYAQDQNDEYLKKIIDAYIYQRDIDGAIGFLEEHKSEPALLYEFYKVKKEFDKALVLLDTLYSDDKNAKWIAEKGVLLFEKSEDKNDKNMINTVLSYFEKAMALGNDDSIYLNYYGYTLIDKEIDVKKGMKIISDALEQQPNNTYYLDSLAWGHYKKGECKKAYDLMKRVVEEEGLEEPEIVTHWNAIQACQHVSK